MLRNINITHTVIGRYYARHLLDPYGRAYGMANVYPIFINVNSVFNRNMGLFPAGVDKRKLEAYKKKYNLRRRYE